MSRYIIKLVNVFTGHPTFVVSGNRRDTPKGQCRCANCFNDFKALRRTDRFCSPACQKKFTKDVRDYESRFGRLEVPIDERIVKKHKAEQKICQNKECKERFYTKANNQIFCSTECRARGTALEKNKDNKKWLRLDRIKKKGK